MKSPSAASSSSHAETPLSRLAVTIVAVATPPGKGAVAIVRVSGPAVRLADGPTGENARAAAAARRHLRSHSRRSRRPARPRLGDSLCRTKQLHRRGNARAAPARLTRRRSRGRPRVSRLRRASRRTGRVHAARLSQRKARSSRGRGRGRRHRRRNSRRRTRRAGQSRGQPSPRGRGAAGRTGAAARGARRRDRFSRRSARTRPEGARRSRLAAVRDRVESLVRDGERGRLLREGVSVAIVGPPNAGKSSLLNALLGVERAIVSEIPGTTRDTVEETLGIDGVPVRLIDTAGIRAHADRLESAGIERTRRALEAARVALLVVDGSQPLGADAATLIASTRDRERVLFLNKADLGDRGAREVARSRGDFRKRARRANRRAHSRSDRRGRMGRRQPGRRATASRLADRVRSGRRGAVVSRRRVRRARRRRTGRLCSDGTPAGLFRAWACKRAGSCRRGPRRDILPLLHWKVRTNPDEADALRTCGSLRNSFTPNRFGEKQEERLGLRRDHRQLRGQLERQQHNQRHQRRLLTTPTTARQPKSISW